MRTELTPTQMAEHLAKRKELWAVRSSGKSLPTGGGSPGENKAFAADTAAATGQSKRAINRAISRAAVSEEIRDEIRGTDLDKGTVLDDLKLVPLSQQAERLREIQEFRTATLYVFHARSLAAARLLSDR